MHFWAVSRLDSCAQKTQYAHKYSRFFQKFVDWNWVSWIIYCFTTIDTLDFDTGKSFSEALIFASTNPQYDDRLFIELQVQYMKIPSSNLGGTYCVQKWFLTFRTIFVHNMFFPCSAKRRASDKDLPVPYSFENFLSISSFKWWKCFVFLKFEVFSALW